jgi:glycosyltransferase involved in cell wall biosynthesis
LNIWDEHPMSVELSLLILTYNKENEIKLILRSLELQKADAKNWELIIIDDGSTDNTVDEINKFAGLLPLKLFRLEHTGNRGYNRNFGINQCRGRRLVHLDGDIVPSRNFLKQHNSYAGEPVLVLGPRLMSNNPLSDSEISFLLKDKNVFMLETIPCNEDLRECFFFIDEGIINKPYRWFLLYSQNISLPLEVMKEVECFDETLIHWGGEDIELGFRLVNKNIRFVYDKECRGIHLYHKESIHERDYYKNLLLFYKKHRYNTVEVFLLSVLLTAYELLEAFENCNDKQSDIELRDIDGMFDSKNTILNHIGIKNENENNYDTIKGLGIYIEDIDKKYENSILSYRLMKMGEAVFVKILENMFIISNNIYIFDPEKEIENKLKNITRRNSKRIFNWNNGYWKHELTGDSNKLHILFSPVKVLDKRFKDYYYKMFFNYLKNHNDISNVIFAERMEEVKTSNNYLDIPYDSEMPSCILDDGRIFLFNQMWEGYLRKYFKDVITVFWDDLWEKNEKTFLKLEDAYDILIFTNENDLNDYKQIRKNNCKPCYYIEPFVDTNVFYPKGKKQNKIFTVTLIKKDKNILIRDDLLIKAFLEEFKDDNDTRLNVYYGARERIKYKYPLFNDSFNYKMQSWHNLFNIIHEGFINDYIEEYRNEKKYKNIRITEKNMSQDELAGIICSSDLNICLHPPLFLLMSIACNARAATHEFCNIYAFSENKNISYIKTRICSGFMHDMNIIPLEKIVDYKADFIPVYELEANSLKELLRREYEQWKKNKFTPGGDGIDEKSLKQISVEHAGDKLVGILKKYNK